MLTTQSLLSNTQGQTTDAGNASLAQLNDDYTNFLTLLTAQIQNQDPLEPVDGSQFVEQLAQLAQVEQAVQSNDRLETLNDQVAALLNVGGTDLLGRDVQINSNKLLLDGGTNTTVYEVEPGADKVTARILDASGTLVRDLDDLSAQSGDEIPLDWDGLDNDGNPVADGVYTIAVSAFDKDGGAISTTTSRQAQVEDVRFSEGELLFGVSGNEVVSSIVVRSAS